MQSIIQSLKKRRKELGLTQKELGAKMGLPQGHISSIEREKTDPRLSTIVDLARYTGQELFLVPREMLSVVQGLLLGESEAPRWRIEDEDDED